MYKNTFGFSPPVNEQIKIWRFIDFTKFVDLIDTGQLYFCQLDKFEDPFEGTFPAGDRVSEDFIRSSAFVRRFSYVNCWHMNDYESAAMWNIYLSSLNGVAIQSTYNLLKQSFSETSENIYLSIVKYHEYESKKTVDLFKENHWPNEPRGSTIMSQVFKRKSFEYESELRAIYIDLPIEYDESKIIRRNLPTGTKIKIDLNKLIDKIYIAPKADKWFKELVASVTKKYGIVKAIEKSNLYENRTLK